MVHAVSLSLRMAAQLTRQPSLPSAERRSERELWLQELWLPSHHEYASIGAIVRVMNHLCFVNSKACRPPRLACFVSRHGVPRPCVLRLP
ncbi:MAG: hypothetical protein SGPRY_003888 [Prymnesium sp.]